MKERPSSGPQLACTGTRSIQLGSFIILIQGYLCMRFAQLSSRATFISSLGTLQPLSSSPDSTPDESNGQAIALLSPPQEPEDVTKKRSSRHCRVLDRCRKEWREKGTCVAAYDLHHGERTLLNRSLNSYAAKPFTNACKRGICSGEM